MREVIFVLVWGKMSRIWAQDIRKNQSWSVLSCSHMLKEVLKLMDWPILTNSRIKNHYSTLPSSQNQFENLSSLKKLETLQLLFNLSIMHEKYFLFNCNNTLYAPTPNWTFRCLDLIQILVHFTPRSNTPSRRSSKY